MWRQDKETHRVDMDGRRLGLHVLFELHVEWHELRRQCVDRHDWGGGIRKRRRGLVWNHRTRYENVPQLLHWNHLGNVDMGRCNVIYNEAVPTRNTHEDKHALRNAIVRHEGDALGRRQHAIVRHWCQTMASWAVIYMGYWHQNNYRVDESMRVRLCT